MNCVRDEMPDSEICRLILHVSKILWSVERNYYNTEREALGKL